MNKLLPCPFCGGDALVPDHADDCYFTMVKKLKESQDAADLSLAPAVRVSWNRRVKPAKQDAPTDSRDVFERIVQHFLPVGRKADFLRGIRGETGYRVVADYTPALEAAYAEWCRYAPAQDAAHPRTAKPCAHLFEARPVTPGSAYSPFEAVCVKCGFKPTSAYYMQQDGGDAEDEWLEELQHIAIQYGCLRYDTAIAEQRCGDHENVEAKAEEKLAELLRHARTQRAAAQVGAPENIS